MKAGVVHAKDDIRYEEIESNNCHMLCPDYPNSNPDI